MSRATARKPVAAPKWEDIQDIIDRAVAAGTHGTKVTEWCSAGRHMCDGIYYELTGGGGGVAGTMRYCKACWLRTLSPRQLEERRLRGIKD